MILKARFVLPIQHPPIENGAVEVRDGVIIAVAQASRFSAADCVDFGDAVILPGLINAHTHLELSFLQNLVPPSRNFVEWLQRLMEMRNRMGMPARSMEKGIELSLAEGVTTVADITTQPKFTRSILAASALRAISFGEVIAMGRGRTLLTSRLESAADSTLQNDRLRVGISPHSPYTVEPMAMKACADVAVRGRLPICVHVAETRDEDSFTQSAEGPLADFIRSLGLWDEDIPRSECSPIDLLSRTNLLGRRTILAHANYVSDADIELIAESQSSVAYCPRTHAAFGHPPHRYQDMIESGVNLCLGTDSLASNPSLSILDEMRFLFQNESHRPDVLLQMATINGARALGLDGRVGTLTPGKAADLTVVPIANGFKSWTDILRSSASPIGVYCDGIRVVG